MPASSAIFFRKNRTRFFSGVVLLAVLVVVAASIALLHLRDATEKRILFNTQSMARSVEQAVEGMIASIDVALLASAGEISRQISTSNPDRAAIEQMLRQQDKRLQQVALLRSTNERGETVYVADDLPARPNIADREYFIRLRGDPNAELVISRPLFGRSNQRWSWIFARRINKLDGSFGGVVLASVAVDEIHNVFGKIKSGSQGVIVLRGESGEMIARYSNGEFFYPDKDRGMSETFKSVLRDNPIQGSYSVRNSRFDGSERTYSYAQNQKYGFLVSVGINHEAAFADWRKETVIILGLTVAFILALCAFATLISRGWRQQEENMAALYASQESLRESEEQLRTIAASAQDAIVMMGAEGAILFWNRAAEVIFGYASDEAIGQNLHHLLAPERYRPAFEAGFARFRTSGEGAVVGRMLELQALRKDGTEFPMELSLSAVKRGEEWIAIGIIRDISARKLAEKALQENHEALRSILETTLDGFWRVDGLGNLLEVNQAYCDLSGFTRDELLTMQISDLEAMLNPYEVSDRIQRIFKQGHAQFETMHRRKNGSLWHVEVSTTYSNYLGGQIFAFMRDITERKRLQDELQQFASFDEMTGAINRRHFMFLARIEHRRAVRLQQELSMALIDLDYLKPINDLHGHAVGDMVLQRLVQVYQKNIREIDIFARLGGDEFVLLLPGASSEQAREVIDRARENLSEQPLLYEGRTVSITTSVGIASIMSDEDTFELLMSRADYAMYQAKQFGRNRIIIS
jgi:diguanylate cyclase (GGDEF)-like protein/PAS domain S-box-containing protein